MSARLARISPACVLLSEWRHEIACQTAVSLEKRKHCVISMVVDDRFSGGTVDDDLRWTKLELKFLCVWVKISVCLGRSTAYQLVSAAKANFFSRLACPHPSLYELDHKHSVPKDDFFLRGEKPP